MYVPSVRKRILLHEAKFRSFPKFESTLPIFGLIPICSSPCRDVGRIRVMVRFLSLVALGLMLDSPSIADAVLRKYLCLDISVRTGEDSSSVGSDIGWKYHDLFLSVT